MKYSKPLYVEIVQIVKVLIYSKNMVQQKVIFNKILNITNLYKSKRALPRVMTQIKTF